MKKYNFIIVITFVSFLALFFAQSVYDTSVHARMQRMADEHLEDVNASALDMDMNLTVRAITGLVEWKDNLTPGAIRFSATDTTDTTGNPFRVNTMLSWDVGSADSAVFGDKTWILGSNMMFPGLGAPALRTILSSPALVTSAGVVRSLGNHIMINGMLVGQDVTTVTPQLDTQWSFGRITSWQILSSEGSGVRGIESYGEIAQYIENIQWDWGAGTAGTTSGANQININGLYMYGMMQGETGQQNPAGWATRTGSTKIGGVFPYYNVTTGFVAGQSEQVYFTADVGSDGTNSRPRLNIPMSGSIRARQFIFGTRNFGPIAIDNQAMYKVQIQFHQL